jgi:hypothetical protein
MAGSTLPAPGSAARFCRVHRYFFPNAREVLSLANIDASAAKFTQ